MKKIMGTSLRLFPKQ